MNNYIEDTENIHNKLIELENCSRRNNIGIDGGKEDTKESWKECKRRFHSMLKGRLDSECGDNVENVRIEWFEKPEIIREQLFANFYNSKINKNILRKAKLLKETDIFINEDYCKANVECRKEL